MRGSNFIMGLILVLLGVAFLLENMGFIDFNWRTLWQFWPVLLIFWGISVLPLSSTWKNLLVFVVLLGTIAAIYYVEGNRLPVENRRGETEKPARHFSEPYDENVTLATLNFNAGAGKFSISGETDQLIDVDARGGAANFRFESNVRDGVAELNLFMEREGRRMRENAADVSLHSVPVWDINLDVGAARIEIDLSAQILRNLKIDAGAASISAIIGDKGQEETQIVIDAGASTISLRVPQTAATEIRTQTALSNKNFPGFVKIENDLYRSEGFNDAAKKIIITLETGVSRINVERY
jgi:hypothetical protein